MEFDSVALLCHFNDQRFSFSPISLEKTKISKGVLFMIAHWFRFVLTLVFRLPKAGFAEYLIILFFFERTKYLLLPSMSH